MKVLHAVNPNAADELQMDILDRRKRCMEVVKLLQQNKEEVGWNQALWLLIPLILFGIVAMKIGFGWPIIVLAVVIACARVVCLNRHSPFRQRGRLTQQLLSWAAETPKGHQGDWRILAARDLLGLYFTNRLYLLKDPTDTSYRLRQGLDRQLPILANEKRKAILGNLSVASALSLIQSNSVEEINALFRAGLEIRTLEELEQCYFIVERRGKHEQQAKDALRHLCTPEVQVLAQRRWPER